MKLSDVSKNIYMRGPSQLSAPLCSQHTFRIYATANGLGGGVQTAFVPGRGKPKVRHCLCREVTAALLMDGVFSTFRKLNFPGIQRKSQAYINLNVFSFLLNWRQKVFQLQ